MEKPARHERIEQLFHAALALDPSERSDFLKRSCASDAALLAEVQSLISEHERTGSFMKSPAYEIKADLLAGPEIRIGQKLDHYRVESKLGEGGMGVVYKAHDTHLNRKVAIKVLPPDLVADPGRKQRFVQEARAASALNHRRHRHHLRHSL